MNIFVGEKLKISIFGESHGAAVGCVIDGLQSGLQLDFDKINAELSKRKPASSRFATKRNESDEFKILSGVVGGKTTGSPLCVIFENSDAKSSDYNTCVPRPGHADFAAHVKFCGNSDLRGGGHFSARLTAPLVFCGAICMAELEKKGITCHVAITSVGNETAPDFYDADITEEMLSKLDLEIIPVLNEQAKIKFEKVLENAKSSCDSVGGCVQCCVMNVPAGLGEPFFNSVESAVARLAFSIPAVKGIEFGKGFELAKMCGSCANDQYDAGEIKKYMFEVNKTARIAYTNNAGGIVGGITNSMPVIFKVAFKPIPTIGIEQKSVDMSSYEPVIVKAEGRHDVCAALRGAFVVKAIACICIYDFLCGTSR